MTVSSHKAIKFGNCCHFTMCETRIEVFSSLGNFMFIHKDMFVGNRGRSCSLDFTNDRFYMYGPGVVLDHYIVHVVINRDMCVTVRARTLQDLEEILDLTCEVCDFPRMNCTCGAFTPRQGSWEFRDKRGNPCRRNLSSYCRDGAYIFADFDMFDFSENVQTQGFEQALTSDQGMIFVKLVEDIATLTYQLKSARSLQDSCVAIGAFVRGVTGQSLVVLSSKLYVQFALEFKHVFGLQSNDWLATVEGLWDNYSIIKKSTLGLRIIKILNHIVAHTLYAKLGIEVDDEKFKLLEEKKLRPKLLDCLTFADAIGALAVFLLRQGRQFMLTGDLNVFFISGETIGDWLTRAKRIKANFEFLSHPDAVDIKVHSYLKELNQAILDGRSFVKTLRFETPEWKISSSILIELETLQKRYLSLAASLSMRAQPLGIVLFGHPGVGKSHINDIICRFFCDRFGLDSSPEYRFYHSSEEEFFTNFKSYMHTVVLDDVAQHKPDKIQGVDPSISTLLKIVNNMPFSPPQAALDDKGKTPVLAQLCMVTTNEIQLNIHHYYNASFAAMRRFPIHIEPVVKEEFRLANSNSLDSSKTDGNLYSNYWNFIVRVPKQGKDQHGSFVESGLVFETIEQLFDYLGPIMDQHRHNQKVMVTNANSVINEKPCICGLPSSVCSKGCVSVQPSYFDSEEGELQVGVMEEIFTEGVPDEEIFNYIPHDEPTPWRLAPLSRVGRKRIFNIATMNGFITKMSESEDQLDRAYVEHYSCMFLPGLMELGYENLDILKDFRKYMGYRYQMEDLHFLRKSELDTLENSPDNNPLQWLLKVYIRAFFWLYFECGVISWGMNYVMSYSPIRRAFVNCIGFFLSLTGSRREFMRRVGHRIDKNFCGGNPIVIACGLISTYAVLNTIYNLYRESVKTKEKNKFHYDTDEFVMYQQLEVEKLENKKKIYQDRIDFIHKMQKQQETQGLLETFGKLPEEAEDDKRRNVWSVPERSITSVDFCTDRASTMEAMSKSLRRACVNMELIHTRSDAISCYTGHAIVVNSDVILINAHAVPNVSLFQMVLYFSERNHGLCAKQTFNVDIAQVTLIRNRDIAYVRTKLPCYFGGNLFKNFAKMTFNGRYDGFYYIRNDDGTFKKVKVFDIKLVTINKVCEGHHFNMKAYVGTPEKPTLLGDCGAPLIMDTGYGPIVVGFHFLYDVTYNTTFASRVCYEDLEPLFSELQVQCGSLTFGEYSLIEKPKSFIDFHPTGAVMYHGELNLTSVRPKTRVAKTEICDQLCLLPGFQDFKFEDKFSKPFMHSWRPQQKALVDFLNPADGLNEVLIAQAAETLLKDILEHLPVSELNLIHTVPYKVAINGVPGMAYMDSMKRATSMGFPYHTTKKKFLEPLADDFWQDGVDFTPEIRLEIETLLEKYCLGMRGHPIFSANLKDEVVKISKYIAEKTRVFFSCPFDFLVVVRMVFMGFTRVVQRNWKIFHCVIGVNAHSSQWQELYDHLMSFGDGRFIAGDFASFDKKFMQMFLRWAFWIIKNICVASGNFSKIELLVIEVIEADLCSPTVNWFGMIITLLNGEVSGHALTTVLNCFCCALYNIYCYGTVYNVYEFFRFVIFYSLGDDHVEAVHEERPLFTHTLIRDVLNAAGVGYTMAEKERESVPYIPIGEVTFLKRQFIFHPALGCICAPLEKDSLIKMLTYQVQSKSCSSSESLAQAMVSASMEAFYHGKEFFNYFEGVLDALEVSTSLRIQMENYPRFTWEQNIGRFHGVDVSYAAFLSSRNQKKIVDGSYCISPNILLQGGMRMGRLLQVARAFPKVYFYRRTELQFNRVNKGSWSESTFCHENKWLAEMNNNNSGNGPPLEMKDLNNKQPTEMDDRESNDQTEQNTYFVHEEKPPVMDLSTEHDPTADMQLIQADLRSFLSRPAKIANFTWSIGASPGILASYLPWSLYFNVPTVNNKLKSFKYIRCNLHLKFVINASPFYYGSIGAFYKPMASDLGDKTGAWAGSAVGQQVLLSQRNHVWLDPQSVSTQEIVLPFLYYWNFLDTAAIGYFNNMGQIDLVQYAGLQSANGVASSGVTINVYAWATEVELAGTTSQLILQGKSEYTANGQISGPASTIASVASRMKKVPIIGPFAAATEVVSSAVSDVASFFGFTNVPNIEDVKPFKSLPFHTLASSAISEPINKLSLQPKQETAVGTYFGDAVADPLLISNFVQRESFLAGAQWTTVNVEDDILFTSAVTPDLFEYASSPQSWYPTPMSYMSSLFQYWSGDIIFRFKIIKSKYHRGRLNICWDVGASNANQMPTVGNPSVFNVIVDLDTEDEVEIRVPYTQAIPFLLTQYYNTGVYWSNGPAPAFVGSGNGFIQIRVLNALSAPVSTSNVNILTFVRGADNLEFAGPRNMQRDKTLLQLQGRVVTLNQTAPQSSDKYKENFGERIFSLRELLHRQSKCASQIIPKNVDWNGNQMVYTFPIQRLPRCYGYHENGWETGAGTVVPASNFPINYVRNHPLNWIVACFVGYKGSTNYTFDHIHQRGNVNQAAGYLAITRRTDSVVSSLLPRAYSTAETNSTSQLMKNYNTQTLVDSQGAGGMALTNQYTQAGLSANLPFYSRSKFLIANLQRIYPSSVPTQWEVELDTFEVTYKRAVTTAGTTDANVVIDIFAGSGPDFEVIYFLNCPAVFQLTPPTALITG